MGRGTGAGGALTALTSSACTNDHHVVPVDRVRRLVILFSGYGKRLGRFHREGLFPFRCIRPLGKRDVPDGFKRPGVVVIAHVAELFAQPDHTLHYVTNKFGGKP